MAEVLDDKAENFLVRPQDIHGLVLAVLLVVAVWVGIGIFVSDCSKEVNIAEALEASGSLFTALAFAAAGYAVYLQRKTILEQQESAKRQQKVFYKQSFENSFFTVLQMHYEISQRITAGVQAGLDLDQFCNKLSKIVGVLVPSTDGSEQRVIVDNTTMPYSKAESGYKAKYYALVGESVEIKPLFRSFSSLCEMVCNSDGLRDDEKLFYFTMIKIRLTWLESFAIIHNCVFDDKWAHVKSMAETYALFEGVPVDSLTVYAKIKMDNSAFGLVATDDAV